MELGSQFSISDDGIGFTVLHFETRFLVIIVELTGLSVLHLMIIINAITCVLHVHVHFLLKNAPLHLLELEEIGYQGFAFVFCGEDVELVGTSSSLKRIEAEDIEYLHSLVCAG